MSADTLAGMRADMRTGVRISVVIPALDEEATVGGVVEKCVASSADEVIVIDSDSTDRTAERAAAAGATVVNWRDVDPRTPWPGKGEALWRGVKAACGDVVVFVDADVRLPDIDDFFRIALDVFRADDRVVALTGRYRVHPETATAADKYVFTMLGLQFWLQNNLLGVGGSGGEFQMIAADAFRDVGGFDETLTAAEDMDLFRRLSRIGRTRFESRLTVYHSGRRAHALGWRTLLWQWFSNSVSVFAFRRSVSKEWTVIR